MEFELEGLYENLMLLPEAWQGRAALGTHTLNLEDQEDQGVVRYLIAEEGNGSTYHHVLAESAVILAVVRFLMEEEDHEHSPVLWELVNNDSA
ncbi:hypothetical protein PC116_g28689 [Phytophthora cactorum]|nr:hypothetical protein PC116_g28689 [Phytophthora cactorum]